MSTTMTRRDDASDFQFYAYQPSLVAAIVFSVLFGLATLLHSFQLLRRRVWSMIPFVIGGTFETAGYIARVLSATQNPGPYTLPPYIAQTCLILVAPALLAASIYMALSRIVMMVDGDAGLVIRRKLLTLVFMLGDVTSFLLQAQGAGLLSSGKAGSAAAGKAIVVAGLFCQLLFFALFVAVTIVFHVRMAKAPTELAAQRPWRKHLGALYAVSGLIFVRSVVRCVEYLEGNDGFVMSHEVFLYVFDAAVVLAVLVCLGVVHPGEVSKFARDRRTANKRLEDGAGIDDDVSV